MTEQERIDIAFAVLAELDEQHVDKAADLLIGRAGKVRISDRLYKKFKDETTPTIRLRKLGQFLAEVGDPPPMLVENVLPEKSLVLLTGKPKFGKSLLAIDMAERVAAGLPVWGDEGEPAARRVNRRGSVVYLSMEDGEYETARRYRLRRHTENSTAEIYICSERVHVGNAEGVEALRREIAALEVPAVLLFVDTGREGLGVKDYSDPAELSDRLRALREFAREVCTVVLVLHNRKAEATDAVDEIAGSNAITSSVDGWISARRKEDRPDPDNPNQTIRRVYLSIDGRGGMGGMRKEICVEMHPEHLGFREVDPDVLQNERQEQKADKAGGRLKERFTPIERYLNGKPDGATVNEITDVTRLTRQAVHGLMSEVLQAGWVEIAGERKTSGRAAPIYKLCKLPQSTPRGGLQTLQSEDNDGEDGGLL